MRFLPPFPVDANDPLDVAVARESLRLRAGQSINARKIIILAAAVAAFSFSFSTPWWRPLCWALSIGAMAFCNAAICARVLGKLDAATPVQLSEFQARLWWMTGANQALMGLTVWWIGFDNSSAVATVATALQLIYVGGALVNASTHPPTLIMGAWINLVIAALFWATQGSTSGIPLAFALLGVGLVVAASSRQTAIAFRESLRMRFENANLLKQVEEEKRVAVEANAAKSRFLAAASHDLRQPLHALLVFSSLLHRQGTPQTAQLVAHIRDAASSLDKLFAGLLDISKLETGSIVAQMQAVNVTAMAQELANEYMPMCSSKGITLQVHGEAAWALTDAFLLERILRNLIDNAIKYTSAGGVSVHVTASQSIVELEVRDTGVGIAPELQQHVFDEYFQVDNPSRDPAKGTGLGLAIVRRLAGLLHTRLELSSTPGQGTKFHLTLPQAPIFDGAGTGVIAPAPLLESLQGIEVWMVEDNEMVRIATTQALQAWGCTVSDWPGMPPAATVAAATTMPRALIADYRLTDGVTGLQVASRLREKWPQLPVAIMTGDPSIDTQEVERLGNVIMMQKPVLPAVMIGWLGGLVKRHQAALSGGELLSRGAVEESVSS